MKRSDLFTINGLYHSKEELLIMTEGQLSENNIELLHEQLLNSETCKTIVEFTEIDGDLYVQVHDSEVVNIQQLESIGDEGIMDSIDKLRKFLEIKYIHVFDVPQEETKSLKYSIYPETKLQKEIHSDFLPLELNKMFKLFFTSCGRTFGFFNDGEMEIIKRKPELN